MFLLQLRRNNSGRTGSQQSQTLQPLSNAAQSQKQGPASPVQPSLSHPPTTYPPPPHQLGNGVLHHHNPYGPPPQESPYYTTHSPYTSTPASAHYPSSGKPSFLFFSIFLLVVGEESSELRNNALALAILDALRHPFHSAHRKNQLILLD